MTLLLAAVATHGLRTVLITLVPAHRLPALLRRGLPHLAPAALAGLVATSLVTTTASASVPVAVPAALAVAALVAWRTRHPALPVLAAVAVTVLAEVLS